MKVLKSFKSLKKVLYLLPVIFTFALFSCGGGGGGGSHGKSGSSATAPSSKRLARIKGHIDAEGLSQKSGIVITACDLSKVSLPGTKRLLKTEEISEGVYRTTTDSNGDFELLVPPAKYRIVADGNGIRKAIKDVDARLSQEINLDFILTPVGDIKGKVIYNGNEIPETLGIAVGIPGTNFFASLDENGNFIIYGVPCGSYRLYIGNGVFGGYYGYYGYYSYRKLDSYMEYPDLEGSVYVLDVNVEPGTNDLGTVDLYKIDPAVVQVFPKDGESVPRDKFGDTIEILFSTNMDPFSTESAITITPPKSVDMKWEYNWEFWSGYTSLEIKPVDLSSLPCGKYTVTISTSAKSASGKNLKEEKSFSFTLYDRLIWTYPGDKEEGVYVNPKHPIIIYFSNEIDPSSFSWKIDPDISDKSVEISKTVDTQTGETYGMVKIYGIFLPDTTYTVTINSAKTKDGCDVQNLPYTFTFTQKSPKVVGSDPLDKASEVPLDKEVSIYFNTVCDRDSVEKAISVKEDGKDVSDIEFYWEDGEYGWVYLGHLCWGDILHIKFKKNYGKTYTVSISGAKSESGKVIPDYSFTFSTLTPKFVGSYPENLSTWDQMNPIEVHSNVELSAEKEGVSVELKKETSSSARLLQAADENIVSDFKIEDYVIYIYPDPQKFSPGQTYKLSISGIKSKDGASLPDFSATYNTKPAQIVDTYPGNGASYQNLRHYVSIDFNFLVGEDDKAKIEDAIALLAKPYESPDETHPAIKCVWGTNESGFSRLYVNFTMDEDTNYKLYFKDENGNQTSSLTLPSGIVLYIFPPAVVFSTVKKPEEVTPNLVYCTDPKDGAQGVSIWDNIYIAFGTVIDENSLDIEIKENGKVIDPKNYTLSFGEVDQSDWWWWNSRNCASLSRLVTTLTIYINLNTSSTYEVTIKNVKPDLEDEDVKETNMNLPYTFTFKTEGTVLYVSMHNETGTLYLSTNDSSVYFKTSELLNALSTNPALSGKFDFEDIDTDPEEDGTQMPEYVNHATYYFSPIQYASCLVEIKNIYPYRESKDENGNTIYVKIEEGFENVPFKDVFVINPDITKPKLEKVLVSENVVSDHTTWKLYFNTFLSKDTLLPENFSVTYIKDGEERSLSVKEIDAGHERWGGYTDSMIYILMKTDPVSPEVEYTVKVGNVKEFGGHYVIDTENDGTQKFTYHGKLYKVLAIQPYDFWNEGKDDYLTKRFAILFDVPMSDDAKNHISIHPAYSGYDEFSSTESTWNDKKDILIITGEYSEDADVPYEYKIDVEYGNVKNEAGGVVKVEAEGEFYTQYPSLRGYIEKTSDTEIKFHVYSYDHYYEYSLCKASAEKVENYTIKDQDGNELTIQSVSLSDDGYDLTITLSSDTPLESGKTYTVEIKNVRRCGIEFPEEYLGVVWRGKLYP